MGKIEVLRRIGAAALIVGGLATSCVAPASAARGGNKPAFWALDGTDGSCDAGATCTASSDASRDGRQTVASSVSRPTAHADEGEWAWGWARGSQEVDVPNGAASVVVKATWRVDRATASADLGGAEGVASGNVFADLEWRGCSACVVADLTPYGNGALVTRATSTAAVNGGLPASSTAVPGTIVTHEITARGPDGGRIAPGTYWVAALSEAYSWVGCIHDAATATLGEGSCVYPMVSGHSGTASADAQLTLLSISVTVNH